MRRPKCPICDLELEGGYQVIKHDDLYPSTKPDQEDTEKLKRAEELRRANVREQVSYYAPNPQRLCEDIEFFAHKDCYEKAKARFPDFDIPTDKSRKEPFYPKLKDLI